MTTGFAIALRVGVFAGIIISLLVATLHKTDRSDRNGFIFWGIVVAVVFSLLVQFFAQQNGYTPAETRLEEIIEGLSMALLAVGLAIMSIRLQRSRIQGHPLLSSDRAPGAIAGIHWGALVLAFLAIAREGFEVFRAVFDPAPDLSPIETILGIALAFLTAVLLGNVLNRFFTDLSFSNFVTLASIIVSVVGAGLLAHAVHEFNHAGILPPVIEHVWDIGFAVNEESISGALLTSLIGYNQDPSLSEVLAYIGYLLLSVLILGGFRMARSRPWHHA